MHRLTSFFSPTDSSFVSDHVAGPVCTDHCGQSLVPEEERAGKVYLPNTPGSAASYMDVLYTAIYNWKVSGQHFIKPDLKKNIYGKVKS